MNVFFPVDSQVTVRRIMPILSRSCRYIQNWVCFLAWTPYSSHTTAYVRSATEAGTEGLAFIALATASSASIRLMSSDLSLESETELYIMALAALTWSASISPESSSSAMLAARSSSSMAILASPYSADSSAITSMAPSVHAPG